MIQVDLFTKQRLIDRENILMVTKGDSRGKGVWGEVN